MISCVMITGKERGVAGLPAMAVECFHRQTFKDKELLIINHGEKSYSGNNILEIKIEKTPDMHVGAMRNMAFEYASGDYIATWDDDDFFAPERLEFQMSQMGDAPICLLKNRINYDLQNNCACYRDTPVGFGGSMLYRRNTPNRYRNWKNNSDAWFRAMFTNRVLLDNPANLYIYNYHGENLTPKNGFMRHLADKRDVLEISESDQYHLKTMKWMLTKSDL